MGILSGWVRRWWFWAGVFPLLMLILVLVLVLLVFLLAWHLRWRAILATPGLPTFGVGLPAPVVVEPAVENGFATMCDDDARTDGLNLNHAVTIVTPLGDHDGPLGKAFAGGLWTGADPGSGGEPDLLDPTRADRLRDLMARGLRVGQLLPLPTAMETWPKPTPTTVIHYLEPDQLFARAGARWYDQAANPRRPSDLAAALDALDALDVAMGQEAVTDWVSPVIHSLRDAAYLRVQLAGAMPPARLAHWLAGEPLAPFILVSEFWRRQFIRDRADRFASTPWAYLAIQAPKHPTWRNRLECLEKWWREPGDAATACAQLADDLASITSDDPSRPFVGWCTKGSLITLSRHRFALLASAIFSAWQKGRSPDAGWLDLQAGRGRAALTLTRVNATDWTITLAPTQSAPLGACWLTLASRYTDRGQQIPADVPGPAFAWSNWRLQVRLPAGPAQ